MNAAKIIRYSTQTCIKRDGLIFLFFSRRKLSYISYIKGTIQSLNGKGNLLLISQIWYIRNIVVILPTASMNIYERFIRIVRIETNAHTHTQKESNV